MKRIFAACALVFVFLLPAGAQVQPPGAAICATDPDWEAPAALRLASVPEGIRLSWILSPGTPTDITGFEIVRADGLDGPYVPVGMVDLSLTEFVDGTAVPGTIYYYQVRAFRGEVCSPFSAPISGQR